MTPLLFNIYTYDLLYAEIRKWHCGLICKLLHRLPAGHMVSLIMKLVCNPSFTLITNAGKQNRSQRFKNGMPQGLVLGPFLFAIYKYDLPVTAAKNFAYADDLAILHYASNWQALKETLTQDMATLSS